MPLYAQPNALAQQPPTMLLHYLLYPICYLLLFLDQRYLQTALASLSALAGLSALACAILSPNNLVCLQKRAQPVCALDHPLHLLLKQQR